MTEHIELFASYFGRLAQAHGLSRAQLTRTLAAWKSTVSGVKTVISETPVYSTSGAGLAGFGDRVQQFVDLIGEATGVGELDRLTLLNARPAFARNSAETVTTQRAWCDECFRDDLSSSGFVYDRLTWTLWGMSRCPSHRFQLRTICPHCDSAQPFHHRSGDPLLCFRCSNELIGKADKGSFAPNPPDAEQSCLQLAGAIARAELQNLGDGNSLHRFEEKISLIVGPVRSSSWSSGKIRKPTTRPTLRTYVSKCLEHSVSIIELLNHPERAAIHAGKSFFASKAMPAEVRIRHPDEVLAQVRDGLLTTMEVPRTEQIPRLRDFAGAHGVSEGYVRHHFASEVRAYQAHRVSASTHLTMESSKRAARVARVLISSSSPKLRTLKELEAEIAKDAKCSVPVARRALAEATKPKLDDSQRRKLRRERSRMRKPPRKQREWIRYEPKVQRRLARQVLRLESKLPSRQAAIEQIAERSGCGVNALRYWVIEEEFRRGKRPLETKDKKLIRRLEKLGLKP
jgi:hypothetical protein